MVILLTEVERLCNHGRGHNKENFCENVLNLGYWFRRCGFKIFLILRALVAILFSRAEPFVPILVEGIMRKISRSYFEFKAVV